VRWTFVVLALVAGCSSPPSRDAPAAAGPPVFVVPGYGGDEASVSALTGALRAAGRSVTVVVPPEGGRARMVDGADALDAAVRGSASFDLVGFSAGGLVVRTWLALNGAGGRGARHVVLLGPPSHGSAALRTVTDCTLGCLDMRPGSALLGRVNKGDETPAGPDYVVLWTADDTAVTPPATARLDGARNVRVQDVCPGRHVEHLALVTDAKVLAMAVRAAADGEAAALGC
jgi:triacylglycerol lipase